MSKITLNEANSAVIADLVAQTGASATEVFEAILFSDAALALYGDLVDGYQGSPLPEPKRVKVKLKLVAN